MTSTNTQRRPCVIANDFPKPIDASALAEHADILPWPRAGDAVDERVEGIYLFGHSRIDAAMLDRLPGLRVISNCGVGVDHIDVQAARERGIVVGNTPGVLAATVADLGFGLLLAAARRLVVGDLYARSTEFTHVDHNHILGRNVHGATLGIVGLGDIGQEVARRARGFDMNILYHNRSRREAAEAELRLRYVSLEGLLGESDFVLLCVPLTSQTRGLIDASALAKMKPTATLINIARGPVVDTDALTDALRARRIDAAALDVTEPEPLPRDHPLLKLDNVIITPHLGSGTEQTRRKMADISIRNLLAGLRGQPLVHTVT